MSSAETPRDPDEPEPTDEEVRASIRCWLIATGCLAAVAVVLIVLGEVTGTVHFFQ
jgi:hypothetical protein